MSDGTDGHVGYEYTRDISIPIGEGGLILPNGSVVLFISENVYSGS